MGHGEVLDKNGNVIHEGDYVFTRMRGGTHEGKVDEIITDEQRAQEKDVKHPPKVSKRNDHLCNCNGVLMRNLWRFYSTTKMGRQSRIIQGLWK
ncbi:uncharacterized protein N7498_008851 [Penicillium cinerascens]|uniref:Hypervirulence associated protein TUDOR domain-containing protein n=1 Tax=Penicillium cinerascens TaxID=70096 RepID=A0A9W9MB23_9EURO|nr:uncharacterized protein N7498_008851 [Penicillium cinerascens]KAJ5195413.1 hypothetical protein N7498_008851 [Penicillium cinerascens]